MHWLLFLSRVAFLSGIVMLIALCLSSSSWYDNHTSLEVLTLAGYGLAAIALPLISVLYLIITLRDRKRMIIVPRWLMLCNILFFIIFLIFTFYINDPYYH
ncbi:MULTISPECIES: hypothetical protein [Chitinophagaceae]|jgi:hypothetical protein|uniref:Uncharacterized protein n=1 Tax=Niabella digestorum TaxID=3117701 RepID=A0ABU7RD25_9BACT